MALLKVNGIGQVKMAKKYQKALMKMSQSLANDAKKMREFLLEEGDFDEVFYYKSSLIVR